MFQENYYGKKVSERKHSGCNKYCESQENLLFSFTLLGFPCLRKMLTRKIYNTIYLSQGVRIGERAVPPLPAQQCLDALFSERKP